MLDYKASKLTEKRIVRGNGSKTPNEVLTTENIYKNPHCFQGTSEKGIPTFT